MMSYYAQTICSTRAEKVKDISSCVSVHNTRRLTPPIIARPLLYSRHLSISPNLDQATISTFHAQEILIPSPTAVLRQLIARNVIACPIDSLPLLRLNVLKTVHVILLGTQSVSSIQNICATLHVHKQKGNTCLTCTRG